MASIVIIAPFKDLAKIAEETCIQLEEHIPILTGAMDKPR